ncbi:hypothetical protein GCM10009779_09360 [Polymorphospora rubra]|uniref:Transposase IS110-like N-terminal domain-containing protein n=1 Tax=Polymorphospora rubra TaxID=338584 RepID=A0A810N738_9ACTN|nr:hypothetical protein Prubr_66220 [Polymorphospora rubra]
MHGDNNYQVFLGLDVGKDGHHAVALNPAGKRLHDAALVNTEAKLRQVFDKLAGHGPVLVVVDQPASIGALPVAVARACGHQVAYLPGLAMRRIADLHPGNAKADARDAYVIADAARTLPHTLRRVDVGDEALAELEVLVGFDDDLAGEATRLSNRIRGLLTQIHPALERVLGPKIGHKATLELLSRCGGPTGLAKAGRRKLLSIAGKKAPSVRRARAGGSIARGNGCSIGPPFQLSTPASPPRACGFATVAGGRRLRPAAVPRRGAVTASSPPSPSDAGSGPTGKPRIAADPWISNSWDEGRRPVVELTAPDPSPAFLGLGGKPACGRAVRMDATGRACTARAAPFGAACQAVPVGVDSGIVAIEDRLDDRGERSRRVVLRVGAVGDPGPAPRVPGRRRPWGSRASRLLSTPQGGVLLRTMQEHVTCPL